MKQRIAAVGLTFLLAGCYPMEQAPLVYASKQTIGLSLAGGTAENPGLDLIIGYKDTNVALVPVAVAKRCVDDENGTDCKDSIYKMEIVSGGKSDLQDSTTIQAAYNAQNKELIEGEARLNSLNDSIKTQEITINEYTNFLNNTEKLNQIGPLVQGEDAALTQRRTEIQSALSANRATAPANTNSINEKARLEREKEALNTRLGAARENLQRLAASLSRTQSGKRTDAYSVYGTFTGGANGKAEGGAVDGDRIFATGIAAQNLTESLGATRCLGNIERIAKQFTGTTADADRKAFIEKALTLCAGAKDTK